jgi:uncharacterized damage-inducible protein DinB
LEAINMATSAAPTPTFTPEVAKAILEVNLASLENEQAATKAVIEAITDPNFKIDPKSRTAIQNAWHIVCSDIAFLEGIANLDFTKMSQEPAPPATIAEVVQHYQTNLPPAIARVRALAPQQLVTPLNFFGVFNFPAFIYTGFALNHHIHHRGQLSASLRPMGSVCPSIYGGSADVPFQMPEQAA